MPARIVHTVEFGTQPVVQFFDEHGAPTDVADDAVMAIAGARGELAVRLREWDPHLLQ